VASCLHAPSRAYVARARCVARFPMDWASRTHGVAQVSGKDRGCAHSCAIACAHAAPGACLVCGEKCATDCCRWTAVLKTKPNSNGFTALYQQSPPRAAALLPRALLSANSTRFYVVVPPLTHRNADVPHTGSLGWQQLRATLDSLGRFGYDDVVLIDNGHQQGPLLRQSFARPVVASSGRQYSFSALADALRHAMHGGLADIAGARGRDGGVGADMSRKHMVLLGHNVRLCRPLRRPRCAVSPACACGAYYRLCFVHTHCCLAICAHRVGPGTWRATGFNLTMPVPPIAMCRLRRFSTHSYRTQGSQACKAERISPPRPPRAGCSPSYSTALRVRGRVQPRPRLSLARVLVRRAVAGLIQTGVFAAAAAEIVAAAPEAARLWAVLAGWKRSV